ncbi:hypothetical protein N9C22_06970, partial [Paracoccaceae bacterium]|nr:hypothetical protein [Paracoccaceae bacterium]
LKIEESGNVVTVSGTATGKLEVSVDASGVATFARYDASGEKFTATTTVSDFYDKQLKGVSTGPSSSTAINEIELNIAGGKFTPDSIYNPSMTGEAVRYVIVDVPEANTVTIKGDLGTNAEKNVVVVRVADPNVGVLDTNNLKVDTSELANVATSDVFELELLASSRNDEAGASDDGLGATGVDKDIVVLDYNTNISGFGLYQVQNGEASWKTAQRDTDGNIVWESAGVPKLKYFAALDTAKAAFSNLPISLTELQANTQFVNSLNTGTLKIQIYPGQESELETYLSSDPALKIVGYKVVVETLTYNLTTGNFDPAPTDLSGTTIQAGLDAITFDGSVNTKDASDIDLFAAALSMLPDQMKTSDLNGDITCNEGIQLSDITSDTSIDMTGILVGDVDGSYIA